MDFLLCPCYHIVGILGEVGTVSKAPVCPQASSTPNPRPGIGELT